jgi:hypothetical protein
MKELKNLHFPAIVASKILMNAKFRMHFLEAINGLSPDVMAAASLGKDVTAGFWHAALSPGS